MTKEEAINYMIKKVDAIERERLAQNFEIEANHKKTAVVERIIKELERIEIDNEDNKN